MAGNDFRRLTQENPRGNCFQITIIPGEIVFINEVPDIIVLITKYRFLFPYGKSVVKINMDEQQVPYKRSLS